MKPTLLSLIILIAQSLNAYALDMPLNMVDGTRHNLSDYQGKWVVVNYWATWCPPCIEEMPDLQAFHNKHVDRDAVVIGINIENLTKERLEDFLDTYAITYPIYVGKLEHASVLGLATGIPTSFLVSPEGQVAAKQEGGVTEEMIEHLINKWHAE